MSESTQQAAGSGFVPSPAFLAREKRLDDVMNLRKPDRVPVAPLVVHYYATRARGISNREAMDSAYNGPMRTGNLAWP